MRGIPVVLAFLFFPLFLAPVAAAQPDEGAPKQFTQGALLYNEGDYGKALVEFKASFALKPNWKVRFFLGVTLHALHRFVEAEAELKTYLKEGAMEMMEDVATSSSRC